MMTTLDNWTPMIDACLHHPETRFLAGAPIWRQKRYFALSLSLLSYLVVSAAPIVADPPPELHYRRNFERSPGFLLAGEKSPATPLIGVV
ncbi:Starch-binding associating with outer membrane [Sesbania bispinosa]|nr:Starch-binding associating with outer membrane [Sesbania bispinosa]